MKTFILARIRHSGENEFKGDLLREDLKHCGTFLSRVINVTYRWGEPLHMRMYLDHVIVFHRGILWICEDEFADVETFNPRDARAAIYLFEKPLQIIRQDGRAMLEMNPYDIQQIRTGFRAKTYQFHGWHNRIEAVRRGDSDRATA